MAKYGLETDTTVHVKGMSFGESSEPSEGGGISIDASRLKSLAGQQVFAHVDTPFFLINDHSLFKYGYKWGGVFWNICAVPLSMANKIAESTGIDYADAKELTFSWFRDVNFMCMPLEDFRTAVELCFPDDDGTDDSLFYSTTKVNSQPLMVMSGDAYQSWNDMNMESSGYWVYDRALFPCVSYPRRGDIPMLVDNYDEFCDYAFNALGDAVDEFNLYTIPSNRVLSYVSVPLNQTALLDAFRKFDEYMEANGGYDYYENQPSTLAMPMTLSVDESDADRHEKELVNRIMEGWRKKKGI